MIQIVQPYGRRFRGIQSGWPAFAHWSAPLQLMSAPSCPTIRATVAGARLCAMLFNCARRRDTNANTSGKSSNKNDKVRRCKQCQGAAWNKPSACGTCLPRLRTHVVEFDKVCLVPHKAQVVALRAKKIFDNYCYMALPVLAQLRHPPSYPRCREGPEYKRGRAMVSPSRHRNDRKLCRSW